MIVGILAAAVFWMCVGLTVYTYAGYPLVLAGLARLRRERVVPPDTEPTVTLLIAAHSEEAVIAAKLENSLELDYPRDKLQIVVAADGSADRTPEIVRAFASRGVQLSYAPVRSGKTAAIVRALPLATGEIVVFSDANNRYAPDTLRELVRPFGDASVGAVSGAKRISTGASALGASASLYWKYEDFIKRQETRLGSSTGAAGEVFAIRRALFEPPPPDIINDDFYIAACIVRRGYRNVYAPRARSMEPAAASAKDDSIRRARIVAGRYQALAHARRLLAWKQPLVLWQMLSHKFLRPLVPLAMLGALLANIVAILNPHQPAGLPALGAPYGWALLGGQTAFYLAALTGRYWQPHGPVGRALYLPTFLVNSNLAAVVGLVRYLTARQDVLWERTAREAPVQEC